MRLLLPQIRHVSQCTIPIHVKAAPRHHRGWSREFVFVKSDSNSTSQQSESSEEARLCRHKLQCHRRPHSQDGRKIKAFSQTLYYLHDTSRHSDQPLSFPDQIIGKRHTVTEVRTRSHQESCQGSRQGSRQVRRPSPRKLHLGGNPGHRFGQRLAPGCPGWAARILKGLQTSKSMYINISHRSHTSDVLRAHRFPGEFRRIRCT
jgi:hypothetical protein